MLAEVAAIGFRARYRVRIANLRARLFIRAPVHGAAVGTSRRSVALVSVFFALHRASFMLGMTLIATTLLIGDIA